MTSYSFQSSLPATVSLLWVSFEQRTRVKTNLSWCPSFPCRTTAGATKKTAWVNPFANKNCIYCPSPSLRTPTEYMNIAFLLKKPSIHLRYVINHHSHIQSRNWECSVHFNFTRTDKGFRCTLIHKKKNIKGTVHFLAVSVLEVYSKKRCYIAPKVVLWLVIIGETIFFVTHNYTEYNQQWNVFSASNPSKCTHTWSSGQPTLWRLGSSRGFGALLKGLTSVVDNSCQSRGSNPQPRVTMLYPLGHGCPHFWCYIAPILKSAI